MVHLSISYFITKYNSLQYCWQTNIKWEISHSPQIISNATSSMSLGNHHRKSNCTKHFSTVRHRLFFIKEVQNGAGVDFPYIFLYSLVKRWQLSMRAHTWKRRRFLSIEKRRTFLNLYKSISDYKVECFSLFVIFLILPLIGVCACVVLARRGGGQLSKNKYFEFVVYSHFNMFRFKLAASYFLGAIMVSHRSQIS